MAQPGKFQQHFFQNLSTLLYERTVLNCSAYSYALLEATEIKQSIDYIFRCTVLYSPQLLYIVRKCVEGISTALSEK